MEYSNYGSESEAEEKVGLLNEAEFNQHFPKQADAAFVGNHATIGTPGWKLFDERLKKELTERAKPSDIIAHGFGSAHSDLPKLFPQCHHVEPFIGYPDKPFGCWRIYESNAWRSYHLGRWQNDASVPRDEKGISMLYSWVIPNFFEGDQWPFYAKRYNKGYVAYMGRIDPCKGTQFMAEVIREHAKICAEKNSTPLCFKFAGQGDFKKHIEEQVYRDPCPPRDKIKIQYVGVLRGTERADFYGQAKCAWLLTNYIEPFGGSTIEAQLTGTPVITVDYGCFPETVEDGVTGFRCNMLADVLAAFAKVDGLGRDNIHILAQSKWSLWSVAPMFDEALRKIRELGNQGWYSRISYKKFGKKIVDISL